MFIEIMLDSSVAFVLSQILKSLLILLTEINKVWLIYDFLISVV